MFFTSESVSEGHPDKVADQISDAILDELLIFDSKARVACEALCKTGLIVIAGEISYNHDTVHKNELKLGRKMKRYSDIARDVVKEIGYNDSSTGFDHKSCGVLIALEEQSPDIAQGVDSSQNKEQGAGDQGMMFGYATTETPEFMPASLQFAHSLLKNLSQARKSNEVDWLRPDAKSQVTVEYDNGVLKRVDTVVLSTMHAESVSQETIKNFITESIIPRSIPHHLIDSNTKYFINPTGKFVIGGPQGDCGLTGRKIIVDTYGGHGAHGGGAFCIASSARVNTELGMKKIADCSEVSGKLVKTDVHPMPSGAWYDNGTKETIFLSTTDGYSLEATPEHLIRVINKNGQYVWKEVQKIEADDYISIQTKNRLFGDGNIGKFAYQYKDGTAEQRKKQYIYPKQLTDDYAYLLGLLVGDGDCTDDGCIKICVCEEAQKTNVQSLFMRLFGDKGKIYGHWAYIGGVELRAYLAFLGLDKSKSFDKKVPETIWTGTKSNMASFLKGLFDTDGCVRIDGRNKTTPRVHLATTSKKLAEDVQLLLLNFGIIVKIGKINNVGKMTLIGKRKVISKRVLYNVTLKGPNSIKTFKKDIGFGLPRKQAILNKIALENKKDVQTVPNQRQRIINLFKTLPSEVQKADTINIGRFTRKSEGKATKELTYEKLGNFLGTYEKYLNTEPEFNYLKELYLMKHYYTKVHHKLPSFAHTYDLNIPETHTFTANGFVVHNSGKDPSKVDRSAAYMGRYIAKNIVAAKLADKVLVQIAYAIGIAKPVSVNIQTFGTEKIPPQVIEQAVLACFDMTPAGIVKTLNLLYPSQYGFTYMSTASYGHFGRNEFPWEKTDKVQDLLKAIGTILRVDGDVSAWHKQEIQDPSFSQ